MDRTRLVSEKAHPISQRRPTPSVNQTQKQLGPAGHTLNQTTDNAKLYFEHRWQQTLPFGNISYKRICKK